MKHATGEIACHLDMCQSLFPVLPLSLRSRSSFLRLLLEGFNEILLLALACQQPVIPAPSMIIGSQSASARVNYVIEGINKCSLRCKPQLAKASHANDLRHADNGLDDVTCPE